MRARWFFGWLVAVGWSASACSLNPQPLPPDLGGTSDAAQSAADGAKGGGDDGSADATMDGAMDAGADVMVDAPDGDATVADVKGGDT